MGGGGEGLVAVVWVESGAWGKGDLGSGREGWGGRPIVCVLCVYVPKCDWWECV